MAKEKMERITFGEQYCSSKDNKHLKGPGVSSHINHCFQLILHGSLSTITPSNCNAIILIDIKSATGDYRLYGSFVAMDD